ncbi:TIGR02588 family protein [Shinella sp. 838]|jgi:uncharacterized protein (TIGR02588 family)|uniref:TIGR02588 family protein n=1 Tax=unclassified Shinella TaxID=2643062 RepID=UPI0003C5442A|nr:MULTISPECIES: TIGR02588 family protein [unclassified Shinella]EYR77763.1 TIGR02588 family protein [Shinella sp. DD12]MCA0341167.1 TIGR02588 family protein [Pseudomonadota bacterium]MDG4670430.1 TIGR02588 family protein [Shinella sp. 838]
MTRSERGRHRERHDPHWIEWLTGLVSALLVAGMLGWIGWEAFTREATPPDLSVTVLTTEKTGAGQRVTFDIANSGTTTAAAVTVIGRLMEGEKIVEESHVVFDYVAAESKSTGAILFAGDPAGRRVDIRAAGYTGP